MSDLCKRAMALVLKHEWSGWDDWVGDGGMPCCPECGGFNPKDDSADARVERHRNPAAFGHRAGCEWAAVALARIKEGCSS
jgi:hypothetical protein